MRGLIRTILFLFGIGVVLFFLLFFSKEVADGVQNGISICLRTIIPSTFLFMVISEWLAQSGMGYILAKPFGILARLFAIPKQHTDVVILSLLGGYPIGARLLACRVKDGTLSKDTASRMLAFCTHASPAFLYTGLGVRIFHSETLGSIFLLATLIGFTAVGFISRFGARREEKAVYENNDHAKPTASVFVLSVKNTVQAMSMICGMVVLFCGILPVIQALLSSVMPKEWSVLINGLLEVCGGCANLTSVSVRDPILYAALFSSFGGVCVFLQIAAMLHHSGISIKPLLFYRLLYTAVVTGCTKLLCGFIDTEIAETLAYVENVVVQENTTSFLATVFLSILMILLLFFSAQPVTIKVRREKRRTRI